MTPLTENLNLSIRKILIRDFHFGRKRKFSDKESDRQAQRHRSVEHHVRTEEALGRPITPGPTTLP